MQVRAKPVLWDAAPEERRCLSGVPEGQAGGMGVEDSGQH